MTYYQGYKSQYQQGSKPYQGTRPNYNTGYQGQGQSQSQGIPQSRIDFEMVLPTQLGLEQFLEMTKALKHIEVKYTTPRPHNSQQRPKHTSTNTATSQHKEN